MASFFSNKARAAEKAQTNGASSSKAPPTKANERLQPWVEKYRPKSLDDVAAQDHTVTVLRRTLQSSNLPHMLFYGPPGTGKTSTILALAKSLYGPALYPSRVLELNASDERGIAIVRDKIKNFARQQLSNPPTHPSDYTQRYPCPPYKIIVLDEADSMTQDAQSALRRTMETYSRITRFCLVCNYVTRIIDPVASRCSKFRFKSLDQGSAATRLAEIAKAENVQLEDGAIDVLLRCAAGDLRKAITFLQSSARLVGKLGSDPPTNGTHAKDDDDKMDVDVNGSTSSLVTKRSIEEIAGVIPDAVVDNLTQAMQPPSTGSSYQGIAKNVTDMVADGWSATQAVGQLYQKIMYDDMISNKQKGQIVMVFSEVDKRLMDGADEHLQILDLALRVSGILAQK